MSSKYLIAGLFYLFIFLFGLWLARTGKPYSTLIFTLHKLMGLATGIYLVRMVYRANQLTGLNPQGTGAVVVTVLLFAAMVATGGLLSTARTMPAFVSLVHKFLPYLTVLSTGLMIYWII